MIFKISLLVILILNDGFFVRNLWEAQLSYISAFKRLLILPKNILKLKKACPDSKLAGFIVMIYEYAFSKWIFILLPFPKRYIYFCILEGIDLFLKSRIKGWLSLMHLSKYFFAFNGGLIIFLSCYMFIDDVILLDEPVFSKIFETNQIYFVYF